MSALVYLHKQAVPAALALLPQKLDTEPARAMILAICLQESRCEYRKQLGGPARGFAQFEVAGVLGVLRHWSTRNIVLDVLDALVYPHEAREIQQALADNDVLAMAFARLLLWTHPAPLPLKGEADKSWGYYLSLWRPGKPHPETWAEFYQEAWTLVEGG